MLLRPGKVDQASEKQHANIRCDRICFGPQKLFINILMKKKFKYYALNWVDKGVTMKRHFPFYIVLKVVFVNGHALSLSKKKRKIGRARNLRYAVLSCIFIKTHLSHF